MMKDSTLGELFRGKKTGVCIRMTNSVIEIMEKYAAFAGISNGDVVAVAVAYYLHDLEQSVIEFPTSRMSSVKILKGKKKNVTIRMTKALQDIIAEHSRKLEVHKSDIVAVSLVAYINGDKKLANENESI